MKCPKCRSEVHLIGKGFGVCENKHRVFWANDEKLYLLEEEKDVT